MKITDIEGLPERLRTAREDLLEKDTKRETLARAIEKCKLQAKAQVASEKDEMGKNKYPNETARDAETLNRLFDNTQYQKHMSELDATRLDIEKAKIEVQFLSDRMETARTVAMLGGGA